MPSTVIDFDACVSRLQTLNPGGFFKTIGSPVQMDPLEDDSEAPAAYLYPGYIDAEPMGEGNARQKINNTLVVDIVCKVADLRTAVQHARDVFIGWEMDPYHSPFTIAATGYQQNQACGPMDIRAGMIHWQERYQNTTHTKLVYNV